MQNKGLDNPTPASQPTAATAWRASAPGRAAEAAFDAVALATFAAVSRMRTPMRRDRKGIALIIAMATVAILSLSITEFAYQTRVNVFIAANARDDLKAYYLAKSGMNIGVVILAFQFELEKDPLIGRFMKRSNFQLYPLMNLFLTPFNTGSLQTPVGGLELSQGATGFGGFHGSFDVHIEPEEGKINLNSFSKGTRNQALLTQLCLLTFGEQHDDLFETEIGSGGGQKIEREQLVSNIVDWVDEDDQRSLLNEFCVPEGTSSGDEGGPYARSDVNYEVKNAKMTTIEELRMVDGVSEAFMQRFADSFTVYPVDKVNLNLANFWVVQSLLCSNVAGANQTTWPCRDPNVATQVTYIALALDGLREFFSNPLNLLFYYMNSESSPIVIDGAKQGQTVAYVNTRQLVRYIRAFKRSPELLAQFISYSPTALQMLGPLAQQLGAAAPEIAIEFNERDLLRSVTVDSPKIFKVIAEGTYGESRKTLVSVVDFSDIKNVKYLYWREY